MYGLHRTTLTAKPSILITDKNKQSKMQYMFGLGLARSDTDVKKKWKDLLSKAKKDVSAKKIIVQSEGAQLLKRLCSATSC